MTATAHRSRRSGCSGAAGPYTVIWGDDRYGTSQNDARPGRTQHRRRATRTRTVDLSLAKRFRAANRNFEGRVEAFNSQHRELRRIRRCVVVAVFRAAGVGVPAAADSARGASSGSDAIVGQARRPSARRMRDESARARSQWSCACCAPSAASRRPAPSPTAHSRRFPVRSSGVRRRRQRADAGPVSLRRRGRHRHAPTGTSDATARLLDHDRRRLSSRSATMRIRTDRRENFRDFDRTWGRLLRPHRIPRRAITNTTTPGAAAYFEYFGERAGPAGLGYYSFDARRVAHHLAEQQLRIRRRRRSPGSPQVAWLQADLAAQPAKCTLAYWHHPLFSSGQNGDNPGMRRDFRHPLRRERRRGADRARSSL